LLTSRIYNLAVLIRTTAGIARTITPDMATVTHYSISSGGAHVKHKHAIAIVTAALSFGLAATAHAEATAATAPGMMGQMMQGRDMSAGGHSGMHGAMAGHRGPMGQAQAGSSAPHQHNGAGAGPMAGGCPMMSMMSQNAAQAPQK
jgi:hypothetical protein